MWASMASSQHSPRMATIPQRAGMQQRWALAFRAVGCPCSRRAKPSQAGSLPCVPGLCHTAQISNTHTLDLHDLNYGKFPFAS